MRAAWLAAAAAAGCGAKAAPPRLDNAGGSVGQAPIVEHRLAALVAAPRPAVDVSAILPDPSQELRWPLSVASHPVLEPRFAIAAAIAEPGVTWLELCARGAQHRHQAGQAELGEYLQAWCSVAGNDADAALAQLRSLTRTTVLGMGPCVTLDIANILADHGSADEAVRLLDHNRIDDVEILDTLSANYEELGREEDAKQINQLAIAHDAVTPHEAVRCHRWARRVVLGDPALRPQLVTELRARLVGQKLPDPTCEQLLHEIECWVEPGARCADYFKDRGMDPRDSDLLDVYSNWPARGVDFDSWVRITTVATRSIPVGGAPLAIAALRTALQASDCESKQLADLFNDALDVQNALGRINVVDRALEALIARIGTLANLTDTACRIRIAKWRHGQSAEP